MIVLDIKDATKRFGRLAAIDDVHLQLEEGQIHCLIGPNGAGKTTLINSITGFLPLTRGRIEFQGEPITGLTPVVIRRKGLARTFQTPRLFDSLTVDEHLQIAHGRSEVAESWSRLVRPFELMSIRYVRARDLSHGQKRYLELAMALASHPRAILLDEPTAGLNTAETERFGYVIRQMRDELEIAALIVEHDMLFVRQASDTVTVLHRGRVLFKGLLSAAELDAGVRAAYLGVPSDVA